MSFFAQLAPTRAKTSGRLVAELGLPILAAVLMAGGSPAAQAAHSLGGSAVLAANIQRPLDVARDANTPHTIVPVTIASFAFNPNSVTINVGDSVQWTNTDAANHTATSDPGAPVAFNTGTLSQNQSATILFNTAGTYQYHCAIHPSMMATLIVNGGATPTATTAPPATATATTVPPTVTTTATTAPPSATATATVPVGTATATVTGTPPSATATVPPSATRTVPPSATRTATVPPGSTATVTRTATVSATPCPIRFSDVTDPSAYYYTGVYYLACRGVISGYADGTFLPFNNTTRGQMAKIVVLAYQIPVVAPATATFADVALGSVFYGVIETAVAHNIVSGYSCGGVNPQTGLSEPCDSAHHGYYRPGNNVSRAQLTKIVVIAAGWSLNNAGGGTFTDVPPTDVFYPYVQTAVCHGIISGYGDNTFRPNNYAFRGQIAKIVYLAVTYQSGCNP